VIVNADQPLPNVSIIIPFLNEEAHLALCLEAVLAQTYPPARLEILLADGGSTDGSRQIADAFSRRDERIHVLDNPQRTAAGGMNAGLAQAGGEIILRVDGHTLIAPSYAESCVRLLTERPDIGNVGGLFAPIGETLAGQAIALALRSPFSMGGSPSRYTPRPRAVDTVYLGAFRRRDLEQLGSFEAALGANEDYEFNYRLRRAGWIIWCDPALRSQTYTRRSFGGLARQYRRYGFWKARVIRLHPDSALPRHLAAPLALLALLAGAALAALGIWLPLLVMLAVYAGAALAASWQVGRSQGRAAALTPLVFVVMHAAWAIGNLVGMASALWTPRPVPANPPNGEQRSS
jgi:GT2 family glycosyltransferase